MELRHNFCHRLPPQFGGTEENFYPIVVLTFGQKVVGQNLRPCPSPRCFSMDAWKANFVSVPLDPIEEKLAHEVKEQASNDGQCENRRWSDEIKRWVLWTWQEEVKAVVSTATSSTSDTDSPLIMDSGFQSQYRHDCRIQSVHIGWKTRMLILLQ